MPTPLGLTLWVLLRASPVWGLPASGPGWDRSRRCAALGADSMAYRSAAASPFCRPEEDPFLLLESSLKAIERILQLRRGLPLRRTWIEQPYGEEDDHAALRQQLVGAG